MRIFVSAVWVVCLLGWSCGGSDVGARPALELRGSLEANPASIKGRSVPVLLFSDGISRLWLQELESRGTFPGELDVALWQPPPEDALRSVGHLDEPPIAVGYLTAVADPHPDRLRFTTTWTRDERCETRCERCETRCEVTERWCGGYLDCYSEQHKCPDSDSPLDQCELLGNVGDAELKQPDPWALLAGVSTNYVFVYVSEALPAASVTAALLASPNGLAAGYHILAMQDLWDSENDKRAECWDAALDAAVAELNEADGTSFQWSQVLRPCADENSWTFVESPLCALPQDERDTVRARLEALNWRARFESGCQLAIRALQPTAANKQLHVRLSNGIAPILVQLF